MSEDIELERLKAKRLAEMQKNISAKSDIKEKPSIDITQKLGYRGLEVLNAAKTQFPNETKLVIERLTELVKTGEINETLDGGKLLELFRAIGLHVKLNTTIHVEKDGKLVSLSDKLKSGDK